MLCYPLNTVIPFFSHFALPLPFSLERNVPHFPMSLGNVRNVPEPPSHPPPSFRGWGKQKVVLFVSMSIVILCPCFDLCYWLVRPVDLLDPPPPFPLVWACWVALVKQTTLLFLSVSYIKRGQIHYPARKTHIRRGEEGDRHPLYVFVFKSNHKTAHSYNISPPPYNHDPF